MRNFVSLVFAFILAGVAQLVFSLISGDGLDWVLIFQLGVGAGLLAFLVSSWRERGPVYVTIAVLVAALAAGLVSAIRKLGFLESFLSMLILQVLFGGLMILGDRLGRGSRWLQLILAALGGVTAGMLTLVGLWLFSKRAQGFGSVFSRGILYILEIPISSAVGLYLSRLILGEKSKPVKESSE